MSSLNENCSDEWEQSKENVQPLKQGRKLSNLTAALAPSSNYQSRLHREKQEFESAIRTDSTDDPLSVWYNYVLWTEENFPKGSKDMEVLLEQGIGKFNEPIFRNAYRNDPRYLTLWIKYADMCTDPWTIFSYLHDNSIGDELALFYEKWAVCLEDSKNFKKADEVLNLGIARSAQPLESLKRNLKEFEIRLSQYVAENDDEYEHVQPGTEENRNPLSGLKSYGKKGTVGVKRTGFALKKGSQGGAGMSGGSTNARTNGFAIFADDENSMQNMKYVPDPSGEWQVPPTHSESVRENVQRPGKWNKSKVVQKHACLESVKPSFSVHVDEDVAIPVPNTPNHNADFMGKQQILSARKVEPKCDPFMSRINEVHKPESRCYTEKGKEYQVKYAKELVYLGTEEFSLEEIRAIRYARLIKQGINLYPVQHDTLENKSENVFYDRNKLYTFEGEFQPEELRSQRTRYRYNPGTLEHQIKLLLNKVEQDVEMTISQVEPCADKENVCDTRNVSVGARRGLSFKISESDNSCEKFNEMNSNQEPHSDVPASTVLRDKIMDEEDIHLSLLDNKYACNTKSTFKPIHTNSVSASIISNVSHPKPLVYNDENEDIGMQQCRVSHSIYNDENYNGSQNVEHELSQMKLTRSKLCQSSNSSYQQFIPPSCSRTAGLSSVAEQTSQCRLNSAQENQKPALSSTSQSTSQFCSRKPSSLSAFPSQFQTPQRMKPDSMNSSSWLTAPSPTITMHTKEATNEIMQMFRKPVSPTHELDPDDINFEAEYIDCTEQPTANLFGTAMPRPLEFTIFDENKPALVNSDGDENQENMPPLGCVAPQQDTKRPFSGILQPSFGIPVCPILDEEHQTESRYIQQSLNKTEFVLNDDITNNFQVAAHLASTPFQGGYNTKLPCYPNLSSIQDATDITAEVVTPMVHPAKSYKLAESRGFETPSKAPHLSPIEELSDEDHGMSSKSSCSSLHGSFEPQVHLQACVPIQEVFNEMKGEDDDLTGFMKLGPGITIEDTVICYSEAGHLKANPFAQDIVERMLQKIDPPITSWSNCHFEPGNTLPKLAVRKAINLGSNVFKINCILGTGGFAKVYKCTKLSSDFHAFDEDEEVVALKAQDSLTFSLWEFYICQQLRERLNRIGKLPSLQKSIMKADILYVYKDAGAILTEYHSNGTLLVLVNLYKKTGVNISEGIAIYYTCELLRILEAVHECGIIHGDIKPDNFMIRELSEEIKEENVTQQKRLSLIDFGRGIDLTLFPKGTTFKANCYTESFQCIEMQEKQPWTFQVDTYGLAGTIYCLIHGEYMKVYKSRGVWKPSKNVQRHWDRTLWEDLFNVLLNVPSCSHQPSLAELLRKFQDVLESNKQTVCLDLKNEDIMLFDGML